MDRPVSLIGTTVGGAFICEQWELRVTARCIEEDLNATPDSDFESMRGLEIVKAFVGDRATHSNGTRQVTPLSCSHEVWVLARGNDHRGATVHDVPREVVWLLAYGRHRSGKPDDFFPYCKGLDSDRRLLPTAADYKRMFTERDRWFAEAVRVEAPVILLKARKADGEYKCTVGGALGIGLSIEVDDELDVTAITVAFGAAHLETYEQGIVLLASLTPGDWQQIGRMPSRELEPSEVAFTLMLESGLPE